MKHFAQHAVSSILFGVITVLCREFGFSPLISLSLCLVIMITGWQFDREPENKLVSSVDSAQRMSAELKLCKAVSAGGKETETK